MKDGNFYVDGITTTTSVLEATRFDNRKELMLAMSYLEGIHDWFIASVDDVISTEIIKSFMIRTKLKLEETKLLQDINDIKERINITLSDEARLKNARDSIKPDNINDEPYDPEYSYIDTNKSKSLEDAYDEPKLVEDTTNNTDNFIEDTIHVGNNVD